jgi:hypothetical protein
MRRPRRGHPPRGVENMGREPAVRHRALPAATISTEGRAACNPPRLGPIERRAGAGTPCLPRYPATPRHGEAPPDAAWPDGGARRGRARPQLRGRGRELDPPRRRASRLPAATSPGAAPLAGDAPLEHGVDLRLRRGPASGGSTGCSGPARHVYGVATALARSPDPGRRDEAGRAGRSPRTASEWVEHRDMDERTEAADRRGDPPPRGGRGRAARAAGTPGAAPPTRAPHGRDRAVRLDLGRLRRRPAPLDRRGRALAARDPLHARGQRHALRRSPPAG